MYDAKVGNYRIVHMLPEEGIVIKSIERDSVRSEFYQ